MDFYKYDLPREVQNKQKDYRILWAQSQRQKAFGRHLNVKEMFTPYF